MTNEQFNTLIRETGAAHRSYKRLLGYAEKEFEERYGFHPSDRDFDFWIDSMHIGDGNTTVEQIERELKGQGYL